MAAWLVPWISALAGGGPDLYGYRWLDSNDTTPKAPQFAWIEIVGKPGAIQLPLQGDDLVSPIQPIGFFFPFYWSNYNHLRVATNGYVGFSQQIGLSLCLAPIPTPGGQGDNFIAPFLGDLNLAENFGATYPNPGRVWMWTNSNDSLVITWENVPFWRDPGIWGPPDFHGDNTFQMILNGADSTITFQYQLFQPTFLASNGTCQSNVEIGIENLTGNVGIAAYSDTLPADTFEYAIRFFPPAVPGFTFPDPAPVWNANPDNAGQFFLPGNGLPMLCGLDNLGNKDLSSSLSLIGKLTPLDIVNILWRDTLIIPGLSQGADSTVQFTRFASLPNAGQYYYTAQLFNFDDVNLSNNTNSVEVSIVDVDQTIWHLSYCTLNNPDGAIGWGVGPDYGVGIFVDPPDGNSEILGVDVFIVDFDNLAVVPVGSGFRVQVVEKDSLGNPGQVLYSQHIEKDSVISDNWNYIVFDSLVTVDSAGFYISWLHDGDSISLGTEEFGPISRRSFEILAGNWSPYRDGRSEDFLIVVNMQGPVNIIKPERPSLDCVLFPNPTREQVTVQIGMEHAGPVDFILLNLTGETVWRERVGRMPVGEHYWSRDLKGLPPGMYWLMVEAGNARSVKKLCVQR